MLTALSQTPRLYIYDNFATEEEAEGVLRLANASEIEALGIGSKHDETGYSFEMPVTLDPLVARLAERVHETIGFPNLMGSTMRFRRYEKGEEHSPHLDCFQAGPNHLIVTAMIYLTDGVEGGATSFPRALPKPIVVPPRVGRLAVWFNYFPNGMEDPASYHEGMTVLSGVKATLTSFVYRPLEDAATRLKAKWADDAERELLCASSA